MATSRAWGRRWYRPTLFGITVVLAIFAAVVGRLAFEHAAAMGRIGADLQLYLDATTRFLSGGDFYLSRQLAGPYAISDGDILYPPTAIPLFALFLVLPGWLFVAFPGAAIAWVVWRHRPAPWAWPLMAACLVWPPSMVKVVHANPVIWVAAFAGLGTVWGWPGVLVAVKPSLYPFAVIGIRTRGWWIAACGTVVVLVIAAPLTLEWVEVVRNTGSSGGLLYSLPEVPFVAIPLIAWAARTRPEPRHWGFDRLLRSAR